MDIVVNIINIMPPVGVTVTIELTVPQGESLIKLVTVILGSTQQVHVQTVLKSAVGIISMYEIS